MPHSHSTTTPILKNSAKIETKVKTYNSRYSPIVTDLTTNLPIYSLDMGERTGSLVLCSLWSYVTEILVFWHIDGVGRDIW